MLVLDTVTDGDAERLYERAGWRRVGSVPKYALMPRGGVLRDDVLLQAPVKRSRRSRGAQRAASAAAIAATMVRNSSRFTSEMTQCCMPLRDQRAVR